MAAPSHTREPPVTDYARWRLRADDDGRHTWHYLKTDRELAEWPQTDMDKYWLGLPMVFQKSSCVLPSPFFDRQHLPHPLHEANVGYRPEPPPPEARPGYVPPRRPSSD